MSLYVDTNYSADQYTFDSIWIDWPNGVINIPRDELTLVQTNPTEIRNMDLNWFRLQLKDLEDTPEGMTWLKTHNHNTEVQLGGITFARVIEILEPYTITFEDGQYAVNLVGANSNVGDRVNVNQVSVRSQNSAGLISSPAIEYSSFNGGVMYDVNSGIVGTAFPRGTEQMPVNNLDDLLLIAQFRGFKKVYLKSNIDINSNYDLSGFEIVGDSHVNTQITIQSSSVVDNVTISNCTVNGILDGFVTIKESIVGNLIYMNGHIENSELYGTINLDGGYNAYIGDCSQLGIDNMPIINMGWSGQDLTLTNYTGILKIINLSGSTNNIGIGLNAGYIILDSATITEGSIIASGIGELIDENGYRILSGKWNGNVNIQNKLINKDTISEASQLSSYVYIDVNIGISGTSFPIGTKRTPSNNLDDALVIANDLGITNLFFMSDYTFDSNINISNYALIGNGINETTLTFISGSIIYNCRIHNAMVTGNLSGVIGFYDAKLDNLGSVGLIPSSQEIMIQRTLLDGLISVPSNYSGKVTIIDSYSNIPGPLTPILDFGNSTGELQLRNYTGGVTLRNMTQGNNVSIDLVSGKIKLENTVTNGTIVARGVGNLVEESTGNYIPTGIWNGNVNITNDVISKGTVADAVLNTSLITYDDPNTVGESLRVANYYDFIHLDPINGVSGTTYPIGTLKTPVNNINDAYVISLSTGIKRIRINGSYTFDSSIYLQDFELHGIGKEESVFTFEFGCILAYVRIYNAKTTGACLGPTYFNNCHLVDYESPDIVPSNITVLFQNCIFEGAIAIPQSYYGTLIVLDSWTIPNVSGNTASFNMNGGTFNIQITNLTGAVKLKNCTKEIDFNLYFNTGIVELEPSVTAGNFNFSGVGKLINSATSTTSIDDSALIYDSSISQAVWDENLSTHTLGATTGRALSSLQFDGKVWLDPTTSYSGTSFPVGTQSFPVNNGPDALQIAIREGISEFRIDGFFTTTTNLSEYTIAGDTFLDDGLTFNNTSYSGVTFKNLYLSGVASFTDCEFVNCYIENIEGLSGELINCRISNYISTHENGYLSGIEIVAEGDNTVIDNLNAPGIISLDVNSGFIKIVNCVTGCLVEMNLKGGEIELDTSCVGGEYYFEGVGTLFNNSTMTKKDNHLLALETIPGPIWDEQLSGHTIAGSTGKALSTASSGGVDYGVLAQAVWDEYLSGHNINDTAAFIMKQIATLADELHKIQGLSQGNPMNITPNSRTVAGISLAITGDGKTSTTVTRQ